MSTRPRSRTLASLIAVTLGVAALITGGAVQAVTDQPACTNNQVSTKSGATNIFAHGTTHFASTSGPSGNLGAGTFTYNLHGRVIGPNTDASDGNLTGYLTATIDWDDSKPTTSFSSTCVMTVETSVGLLISGRYAGTVQNAPCVSAPVIACTPDRQEGGSSTSAVANIALARQAPRRADLDFALSSGNFCSSSGQFQFAKHNAQALGNKTGNAGRFAFCD